MYEYKKEAVQRSNKIDVVSGFQQTLTIKSLFMRQSVSHKLYTAACRKLKHLLTIKYLKPGDFFFNILIFSFERKSKNKTLQRYRQKRSTGTSLVQPLIPLNWKSVVCSVCFLMMFSSHRCTERDQK